MKRKQKTILVIEDEANLAKRIKAHIFASFEQKIQVLIAPTFALGAKIIKQKTADMFIVNLSLADGSGEALVKLIRKASHTRPIIVQGGAMDVTDQLKLLQTYDRIKCLTKGSLFEQLTPTLNWAIRECAFFLPHRLLVEGGITHSVSVDEICFIEKIPNERHLHIEFFDFEARTYRFVEFRNTSLATFLSEYNQLGIFLRCHQSFIVNKKMVEQIHHVDREILLLYRGENDREVRIPIGDTRKKQVLDALKGLY